MAGQGSNAEPADDELFDERVRRALQRMPVPSGLAARLQAQLRAQTFDANESASNFEPNFEPKSDSNCESESDFANDQVAPEGCLTESSGTSSLRAVPESAGRNSERTSLAADAEGSVAKGDLSPSARGGEALGTRPGLRHLRRSLLTAAAIAAAVGLLAVGRVWFRPAATLDDLVSVCRTEVARWERTATNLAHDPDLELPPEIARLDLNGFRWVGARYFQSESFGAGASWKLQRREDEIVILVIEQAAPVASLAPNLTVLQSSGAWSLAAMQASNRIVVIASRGDVRRFLRPIA